MKATDYTAPCNDPASQRNHFKKEEEEEKYPPEKSSQGLLLCARRHAIQRLSSHRLSDPYRSQGVTALTDVKRYQRTPQSQTSGGCRMSHLQ